MPANKPIRRLLIANRGEIAVRIARTCRSMDIHSIAVFSDADVGAVHVRECDEAVHIGPAPARESYLDIGKIAAAARAASADAIHPGYGFLSENTDFARACRQAGIIFVGPTPEAMEAVGDKISAKRSAEAAGVPTVPGYLGDDQDLRAFAREAERIGAPVLVKAAAGGGGKGMRLVRDLADLREALEGAQREARSAFGDGTVFLEKYLESPRHIEVQILADRHGNAIHLNERDCSIQRRHQKIVEETPSPAVSTELRRALGDAALRIAAAVSYENAGTVEFMLDATGTFYFLEVNARLQVEHPVTELVAGVDLVREQILIAAGEKLRLSQDEVAPRGHAIEVRIYAEDPANGFLPSSGHILDFSTPAGPGVRVDAGIAAGSVVTTDYDPMLAKLIAYGSSRGEALGRLHAALHETHVAGIATNIEFLRWLAHEADFAAGKATTAFLETHHWKVAQDGRSERVDALAAAGALQSLGAWRPTAQPRVVSFVGATDDPIDVSFDWRSNGWRAREATREALIVARDEPSRFDIVDGAKTQGFHAWRTSGGIELAIGDPPQRRMFALEQLEDVAHAGAHAVAGSGSGRATAPLSGTVVKIAIEPGSHVRTHQVLVVIEAMKMEHAIAAPFDGRVRAVNVKMGGRVDAGDVVVEIEAA
ncbi:MAG: acetyl-CoA carboxylase biotin carboxylase subunit [Candidatus Eremiobacteraeota bacterium]|nr:acetyl-CoA carboxylase biotin carboxylase subunit [Candidatus Eremiobacteraeota bacterium]